MARILVVDDEIRIREMIFKYASHEGYDVVLASDGLEAIELFERNDFDVVVMDIMMPKMDGFETLKRMKKIKDVHCIFLSALGEEYDRVYGFDIGGEDYVTKPFSLKELMMRIKVILKRDNQSDEKLIYGDIVIDKEAHILTIKNKRIDLPYIEYEILTYLIKNHGKVLSREAIVNHVWKDEDVDDRTINTHIKCLRKALGKYSSYIKTIRRVGYRFEKED